MFQRWFLKTSWYSHGASSNKKSFTYSHKVIVIVPPTGKIKNKIKIKNYLKFRFFGRIPSRGFQTFSDTTLLTKIKWTSFFFFCFFFFLFLLRISVSTPLLTSRLVFNSRTLRTTSLHPRSNCQTAVKWQLCEAQTWRCWFTAARVFSRKGILLGDKRN